MFGAFNSGLARAYRGTAAMARGKLPQSLHMVGNAKER